MSNIQQHVENTKTQAIETELNRARRENAELKARLEEANRSVDALTPVRILPENEQPFYEVINAPYYSADGLLYEVGSRFRDLTGTIIPSESFLALNEPAKQRVSDWLMSLPDGDETPNTDAILEAAMEVNPFNDDGSRVAEAEYKAAVVKQAILKKNEKKGPSHDPKKEAFAGATRNPAHAPMMTNMRKNAHEKPKLAPRTIERVEETAGQTSGSRLMNSLSR